MKKSIAILLLPVLFMSCAKKEMKPTGLIGKYFLSEEATRYFGTLECKPEIDHFSDSSTYFVYYNEGVDFCIDKDDTIRAVFIYADDAAKHKAFSGALPYGVRMDDARKTVESKTGLPTEERTNGDTLVWTYYNAMLITYQRKNAKDTNCRLVNIAYYENFRE